MRFLSFLAILIFWSGTGAALAQEPAPRGLAREGSPIFRVTPRLAQTETRVFAETSLLQAEKTQPLAVTASDLVLEYSSDAPFEVWVSYLNDDPEGGEGAVLFNPYHTLKTKLEPQSHGRVSLDLTRSPAWSPLRKQYLLHVFGLDGQEIEIFDLAVRPPTFLRTLRAAFTHLNLDEPVLLSSVNFLWGYRVLDTSFALLLGLPFLIAMGYWLFVFGFSLTKNEEQTTKNRFVIPLRQILLLLLLLCFVYDVRFSFDLARTTVADLRQWNGEYQYRQLGPVHAVADYLETERARFRGAMKVAVCYDGTDFLEKQLRYLLYPTPVEGAEDLWNDATHAVFIDTERGSTQPVLSPSAPLGTSSAEGLTTGGMVGAEGTVSCGDRLLRAGQVLRSFSQRSRVVRFSDSST